MWTLILWHIFFFQQKGLFNNHSVAYWVGFLEKSPHWVVRWWSLHRFVTHGDHSAYVALIGLTMGTDFFPGCLLRQCGHRQPIPQLGCIPQKSWANNLARVHFWTEYWLCRPLLTMPTAPRSTYFLKFCIEWRIERNVGKMKALQEKEKLGFKRWGS